MRPRLLLASIHEVSPLHVDAVERLRDLLTPTVGSRLAMLVVPNHWSCALIDRVPAFRTRLRVWRTADGTTLARTPVVTRATRTPARLLSSLAAADVARIALRPLPVVRIGVHPGDIGSPAVMRRAAATLATLSRGRVAGRYAGLMSASDRRPTAWNRNGRRTEAQPTSRLRASAKTGTENRTRQTPVPAHSTPKSLSHTSSRSGGDRIAMPSRSAPTSGASSVLNSSSLASTWSGKSRPALSASTVSLIVTSMCSGPSAWSL